MAVYLSLFKLVQAAHCPAIGIRVAGIAFIINAHAPHAGRLGVAQSVEIFIADVVGAGIRPNGANRNAAEVFNGQGKGQRFAQRHNLIAGFGIVEVYAGLHNIRAGNASFGNGERVGYYGAIAHCIYRFGPDNVIAVGGRFCAQINAAFIIVGVKARFARLDVALLFGNGIARFAIRGNEVNLYICLFAEGIVDSHPIVDTVPIGGEIFGVHAKALQLRAIRIGVLQGQRAAFAVFFAVVGNSQHYPGISSVRQHCAVYHAAKIHAVRPGRAPPILAKIVFVPRLVYKKNGKIRAAA